MKTTLTKNLKSVDDNTKAEIKFFKTNKLSFINLEMVDNSKKYKLRLSTRSGKFFVNSILDGKEIIEDVNSIDIGDIIDGIRSVTNNDVSKFSLTIHDKDENYKHCFMIEKKDGNIDLFLTSSGDTSLYVSVVKDDIMPLFDRFEKSIKDLMLESTTNIMIS